MHFPPFLSLFNHFFPPTCYFAIFLPPSPGGQTEKYTPLGYHNSQLDSPEEFYSTSLAQAYSLTLRRWDSSFLKACPCQDVALPVQESSFYVKGKRIVILGRGREDYRLSFSIQNRESTPCIRDKLC